MTRKQESPTTHSRAFQECLSILVEELQLAVEWNRPSILLAVHASRLSQNKAMDALEKMLGNLHKDIQHVNQASGTEFAVDAILHNSDHDKRIFFISGLGNRTKNYYSLNLARELIVENRLKMILWLTEEEAFDLPRYAPDFWAFRHRVVEFSAGRRPRKAALPSGLLLWEDALPPLDEVASNDEIQHHEKMLRNFPKTQEARLPRAETFYTLANRYWLREETQKAGDMLRMGLESVSGLGLFALESLCQNGEAVIAYEQGEYQKSLEAIERAKTQSPENHIVWANHAVILHAVTRDKQSIRTITKAARLASDSSVTWFVMGHLYASMGKFAPALSAFQNALNRDPENSRVLFSAAACHANLGNMDALGRMMQLTPAGSGSTKFTEYESICREMLMGDATAALARLKAALQAGQLLRGWVKRDPVLHLIFGFDTLDAVLR